MRLSFRLLLALLLPLALVHCTGASKPPETGQPIPGETRDAGGGDAGTPPDAGDTLPDAGAETDTPKHSVILTLMGLRGQGLKLANNGETLEVPATADEIVFPTKMAPGEIYNLTLVAQPISPWQRCDLHESRGRIEDRDVHVYVSCYTLSFSVGGTASGLLYSLELTNGTDTLRVGRGEFRLFGLFQSGTAYDVKITAPAPYQDCTLEHGSGIVGGADVTDITVKCTTRTHRVSAVVSGLVGSMTLTNSSRDNLVVTRDGTYVFPTPVEEGDSYFVNVYSPPPTQRCTSEQTYPTSMGGSDVSVRVTCVTYNYSVGGTVTGLSPGDSLTLANGSDTLSVTANGPFTMPGRVDQGSPYNVVVKTPPTGKRCGVQYGSGTMDGHDIGNVSVTCAGSYTLGGSVKGLAAGDSLTLANDTDEFTLTANGPFTMPGRVYTGSGYSVIVETPPSGKQCTVVHGAGTMGSANVTDITVTCAVNAWSVGGSVQGLNSGQGFRLRNNDAEELTVTANGPFTFPTRLAEGSGYSVSFLSQPNGQRCTLTHGSGTVGPSNVTDVTVTCVAAPRVMVLRVGNPFGPLSSAATGIYLDTYTVPEGDSGSTIAISSSVMTISGNDPTEGMLSLSGDGHSVVFAGYLADQGTAAVSATTSASVPRVVGLIEPGVRFDRATLNNAFSTGSVRAATTVDGNGLWVAGTGTSTTGGVHYVVKGSTGASTRILETPNNTRGVLASRGQLYMSTSSGGSASLFAVGSGLPTTAGQTATGLPGVPTFASARQFFLMDRDASIPGDDTLYVADGSSDTGGVFKFVKGASGTWSAAPLTNPGPAYSVTALLDGTTTRVVAVLAPSSGAASSSLVTFEDDGTSAASVKTLAIQGSNSAFRGVCPAPVPAP